jgi:hypothetical protein
VSDEWKVDPVELAATMRAKNYRVMNRPEPGLWAIRLARGGAEVAARIFWRDHQAGNPEKKLFLPELVAEINGQAVELDRVWHTRGRAIDQAEYDFLIADRKWAKEHAPEDPAANPYQPVDLLTVKPPF